MEPLRLVACVCFAAIGGLLCYEAVYLIKDRVTGLRIGILNDRRIQIRAGVDLNSLNDTIMESFYKLSEYEPATSFTSNEARRESVPTKDPPLESESDTIQMKSELSAIRNKLEDIAITQGRFGNRLRQVEDKLGLASYRNEVYLDEQFNENPINKTWFNSEFQYGSDNWRNGYVPFSWSPGAHYRNSEFEAGLSTAGFTDKVYAISTKFPSFSFKSKKLVLQFSVKYEQSNFDYAGGYIRLYDCSLDPLTMNAATPALLYFGLNMWNILHVLNIDNNFIYQEPFGNFTGGKTRVLTLTVEADSDRSFSILDDGVVVKNGKLTDTLPNFNGWDEICGAGFEIYQQFGGTVFDNVLITSNSDLAKERQEEILRETTSDDSTTPAPRRYRGPPTTTTTTTTTNATRPTTITTSGPTTPTTRAARGTYSRIRRYRNA